MFKILIIFIVFLLHGHGAKAKSKSVEASLTAKWKNTPIIFEARYDQVLSTLIYQCRYI